MVTVRTILALAAARQWHIHQMNVYNTFLQGDLLGEIYMDLPRGFESQGEKMRKYALELIVEVGLTASILAATPIDTNVKLITKQYDEHIWKNEKSEADPTVDQTAYQRLTGKLLYLTVTRPDISFRVQTLSQFLQQSKKSHMEAALRIVKYVKSSPGQGILLSSHHSNIVIAYCDADCATCPTNRRSVTDFLIKIGNSLVS
ncbi:PREDICTED: uncharacterized protein LOC109231652 [Nicotiana attenuata]|uniref:uncharacterized protein LOC109231652 n=1 Tax=Nicotiana attenuata TaxID=49451 RepID=UPI0009059B9A|nr:PREDICTED: uncharacterized protein LOC109231652 [Nicotiana attenuata]